MKDQLFFIQIFSNRKKKKKAKDKNFEVHYIYFRIVFAEVKLGIIAKETQKNSYLLIKQL